MHAGKLRRWMLFAPLLLVLPLSALILGACGGDDDSGGSNGGGVTSGGSGSDADYVKAICVGFNKYIADFTAAIAKDPTNATDPAKAMKASAPMLSDLADAVSKAKPPKDVKSYNDQLVKSMRDAAQQAKDGKITSFDQLGSIGNDVPEPSQAIKDRLSKAASGVSECSSGGFSLFGD
jgi:hypothetical protein